LSTVAVILAALGAMLGISLLFKPNARVRLGFYGCILGSVLLRVILALTQGMALNWLDIIVAVSLAVGIALEVMVLVRGRQKGS